MTDTTATPPAKAPAPKTTPAAPPKPVAPTPTKEVAEGEDAAAILPRDEALARDKAAAEKAAGDGPQTHVLGPQETLAKVAEKYGTTPEALAKENGFDADALIYTGSALRIPK